MGEDPQGSWTGDGTKALPMQRGARASLWRRERELAATGYVVEGRADSGLRASTALPHAACALVPAGTHPAGHYHPHGDGKCRQGKGEESQPVVAWGRSRRGL